MEHCSCRLGPIRDSAGLRLSEAHVARKPYLCVLCLLQGISLKAAGHLGRGDAAEGTVAEAKRGEGSSKSKEKRET